VVAVSHKAKMANSAFMAGPAILRVVR